MLEGEIYITDGGVGKRIGEGKDVALARGESGVYAAWTRRTGLEISTPGAAVAVPLTAEGAFVNLLSLPDGSVLAASEAKSSIETRRVR